MTFSSRREPTFDGAHSPIHAPSPSSAHAAPHLGAGEAAAHRAGHASGLTRVVTTVQIVGSLLAVPLGLASGYSMYKANFAVDTTCQNLRASIVAMLDKNVDASTRRMLVRRDVATFEQTCGDFDPDAHAAFKTLLAAPAAAPAPKLRSALPASDVARKVEPKAEVKSEPKLEAKSEPRAAVAGKAPVVAPQPASIESIEREAALSDTRWLAAVRQAIVAHGPAKADDASIAAARNEPVKVEQARVEPAKVEPRPDQVLAKPAPASVPIAMPAPQPAQTEAIAVSKPATGPAAPPVRLQPTWNVSGPPVPPAPVVEAPAAVTTMRDDHPVPPASIPVSAPGNGEAKPAERSRIGSWIAEIPLVGRVIEPRGN